MIAYVRVSTSEQGESRLGLEAQRATIGSFAAERGWEITTWCEDVGRLGGFAAPEVDPTWKSDAEPHRVKVL